MSSAERPRRPSCLEGNQVQGAKGLWSTFLTFYGDAVDKPGNLRFGLAADSAHQDAGLIGGEDQVPRSADPEWSRCGRGCERMKGGMCRVLLLPPAGRHYGCLPLTVTLMMWCMVPSLFVAMQR